MGGVHLDWPRDRQRSATPEKLRRWEVAPLGCEPAGFEGERDPRGIGGRVLARVGDEAPLHVVGFVGTPHNDKYSV